MSSEKGSKHITAHECKLYFALIIWRLVRKQGKNHSSYFAHLSDILLLFRLESQFNENLLQLLIAVVNDKLFKAVGL